MQTVARRDHEAEWRPTHVVIPDAPWATLTTATKADPRVRANDIAWVKYHASVMRRLCAASSIEVDDSRSRVPKPFLIAHLDVNMGQQLHRGAGFVLHTKCAWGLEVADSDATASGG